MLVGKEVLQSKLYSETMLEIKFTNGETIFIQSETPLEFYTRAESSHKISSVHPNNLNSKTNSKDFSVEY